jgi:hypothetical protein
MWLCVEMWLCGCGCVDLEDLLRSGVKEMGILR